MMTKIPHAKDYLKNLEINERRPGKPGVTEYPCMICGKPVIVPAKYMVWLHEGGGALVTAEEAATLDPSGDMGDQPVGADCWKKNPSIHKYRSGAY